MVERDPRLGPEDGRPSRRSILLRRIAASAVLLGILAVVGLASASFLRDDDPPPPPTETVPALARLRIIFEHVDGFRIAHEDLLLRGPGEYLGARQSGAPLLRFADLTRDADLLEAARTLAESMFDRHPDEAALHVRRWMSGRAELLRA